MSKAEEETPSGYLVVDLPKIFACLHTRGLKASVDKAKLLQVLEEAEEKSRRKHRNLEEELKQLREENKRLKEKISEQSLEEGGDEPPKIKRRKSATEVKV